jgi:hypothetical protein
MVLLLAMAGGAMLLSCDACAEQGVRIYGFVYDQTGLPVSNATVTLLLDDIPLLTYSNPATTDLHGYYEFPGIQHGTYNLIAEKNFYSSSDTIRVQTWDVLHSFTLQGSTANLADMWESTPTPLPTPSPTPVPEVVTTTPEAPGPSPAPSATPGFDIAMVLTGLLSTVLIKWLKQ